MLVLLFLDDIAKSELVDVPPADANAPTRMNMMMFETRIFYNKQPTIRINYQSEDEVVRV